MTSATTTAPTRDEILLQCTASFRARITDAEQFHARETEAFLKCVNERGILTAAEWRTDAVAKAHGKLHVISQAEDVFDDGEATDAAGRFARLVSWADTEILRLIGRHPWDQYSTNPIANVIESAKLAGAAAALHEIREFAAEVLADLPAA